MRSCRESSGRKRPERRGAVLGAAAILLLLATPSPLRAAGHAPRVPLLTEFNAICADLGSARGQLARGALGEDEFVDAILDLFVRADSLATVASQEQAPARGDLGSFALQKGVLYLIESLRENYVGVVGQDGVSFVDADQALRAAVAWRSGASDPVAAP